ncbi:MAG: DNA-directed RNA polymerase subunit D [Candidatus Aenigmatarchaeota archaeon]
MNLKILEKSDRRMEFILDCDPAFANALRRIMISEMPVLAIEYVEFEYNSSGLFDEVIAHRLGLIPLVFPDIFEMKSECKCKGKGCSRCEVVATLEKEGPCIVKASDLIFDGDVTPFDPDIPIVELLEGHKIKFRAFAQLGFGRDHAKYQAATVGYRNVPVVRFYSDKCDECGNCIDVCPKNIFQKKDGKIGLAGAANCNLCLRCMEVCDKKAVTVAGEENNFIFKIESISGMNAVGILSKALDILEKRALGFIKEVRKEVK